MSYEATQTPASQRIAALLDAGSFVEIGGAVTARSTDFNMQGKEAPGDGVYTGYGVIEGGLVYVYSQDASVLNGTIGEMHARKIVRIYDLAMKMGAPVIGLIDCAGLRLQEATDALYGFGSLYKKMALASGVIPQITGIFGACGGGLAIVPGLTDFTFMEGEKGTLFLNSPNAIPGNDISKCNTSSALFQSKESGLVDKVGSEQGILSDIRTLVTMIPSNNEDDASYDECTDDLNRLCPDLNHISGDPALALRMISDHQIFFEIKQSYAPEMVTGFIRLNGLTIGVAANRTRIFDDNAEITDEFDGSLTLQGCQKASDFINFCDAFHIPLLSLTDVNGFAASKDAERMLARETAKLTYAFINATVPKVNVIVGKALGSAGITMNSSFIGADIVYAWPEAQIGMMDPELAAKIMYSDADADTLKLKTAEYQELQSSPQAAARRGYVDAVIEPESTRKYLIGAFEMLFTKREERPVKKHGTV